MEKDKNSLKNLLFLVLFVLVVITISEAIGIQFISIGKITVSILPLVFAVTISMFFGIPKIRKGLIKRIYTDGNINFASKYLLFIMLPLMAR